MRNRGKQMRESDGGHIKRITNCVLNYDSSKINLFIIYTTILPLWTRLLYLSATIKMLYTKH